MQMEIPQASVTLNPLTSSPLSLLSLSFSLSFFLGVFNSYFCFSPLLSLHHSYLLSSSSFSLFVYHTFTSLFSSFPPSLSPTYLPPSLPLIYLPPSLSPLIIYLPPCLSLLIYLSSSYLPPPSPPSLPSFPTLLISSPPLPSPLSPLPGR